MSKINFSKSEKMIVAYMEKAFVDDLYKLSCAADGVKAADVAPTTPLNAAMQQVFIRFQSELNAFKRDNHQFYQKLSISSEEEKQLNTPIEQLVYADWLFLKKLKQRFDDYIDQEASNQQLVVQARKAHKTKQLNTRNGWIRLD